MNSREKVLKVIQENGGTAVAQERITEEIPEGESALQGLQESGVLTGTSVFNGGTYWSINDDASKQDIKQALNEVSASEVADQIIQQSSVLGDPTEADPDRGDIFKNLF